MRHLFAISFAAVMAACMAACGGSNGGTESSPSAAPTKASGPIGLLPMTLDVSGSDVKGAPLHHYWVYGTQPVHCLAGDVTPYATQIRNAVLTVSGYAAENYKTLYFIRCGKSTAAATPAGSSASPLPLPLDVDIVGNDVTAGVIGKKFDRHLRLDKAAVACEPMENPVAEPGSGKPGQRVSNASVTIAFAGKTQTYHGSDAYFIRCSKEHLRLPMLRR